MSDTKGFTRIGNLSQLHHHTLSGQDMDGLTPVGVGRSFANRILNDKGGRVLIIKIRK